MQIIWCYIVFPIRHKILKPGYRVAEKKNQETWVFFGFWNKCDVSWQKLKFNLKLLLLVTVQFFSELLIKYCF